MKVESFERTAKKKEFKGGLAVAVVVAQMNLNKGIKEVVNGLMVDRGNMKKRLRK